MIDHRRRRGGATGQQQRENGEGEERLQAMRRLHHARKDN
jgi:hypothetical protein